MNRRALLGAGMATVGLVGCSRIDPRPVSVTPAERQVAIGFEDLTRTPNEWEPVAAKLDDVGCNSLSISVGRMEWTGFPWEQHPDAAPSEVTDEQTDLVRRAIHALAGKGSSRRRVVLSIDAMIPDLISEDPSLAGISRAGRKSEGFASATALSGPVGDRLVEFAATVVERFSPDEVNLTELLFDGNTFGNDDLELYRRHSGNDDWPRTDSGNIDASHESLGAWRSSVIAGLVERVAKVVRAGDSQLSVDVRVNWSDPAAGRPASGHDHQQLAEVCDRLVLWNFFGMVPIDPRESERLVSEMIQGGLDPQKLLVQVGLWGKGERQTISSDQLRTALTASCQEDVAGVSVTPRSRMRDSDWAVLKEFWA